MTEPLTEQVYHIMLESWDQYGHFPLSTQLAAQLGVSRQRVQQIIHQLAIEKPEIKFKADGRATLEYDYRPISFVRFESAWRVWRRKK